MTKKKSDISSASDVYDPICEITRKKIEIEPFTMVIFGGTGDLSRRKLLPTIYHLCIDQNLPDEFAIIGFAASERSDEDYREIVKNAIQEFGEDQFDDACWENFSRHLFYVSGSFEDNRGYKKLSRRLEEIVKQNEDGAREIIYYMAVPPRFLPSISGQL